MKIKKPVKIVDCAFVILYVCKTPKTLIKSTSVFFLQILRWLFLEDIIDLLIYLIYFIMSEICLLKTINLSTLQQECACIDKVNMPLIKIKCLQKTKMYLWKPKKVPAKHKSMPIKNKKMCLPNTKICM